MTGKSASTIRPGFIFWWVGGEASELYSRPSGSIRNDWTFACVRLNDSSLANGRSV